MTYLNINGWCEMIFYTGDSVGSSITLVDLKGSKKPWTWVVYLNRLDLCIKGKKTAYYFKSRKSATKFFEEERDKVLLSSEKSKHSSFIGGIKWQS